MSILFPTSVFGTSVIAVWTQTEIVIAADSKYTPGAGYTGTNPLPPVCKIFQAGDAFFALAGFTGFLDGSFDVKALASSVLKENGSLSQRVNRFENRIQESLSKEFRNLNPADYGMFKVEIIFVGLERGTPVVLLRAFIPKIENRVLVGFTVVRTGSPENTLFFIGENQAVIDFVKQHPIKITSPPDAARTLVEMEIKAKPELVGGPIDILRITKDGARWVQKKKECPDIQNPSPKPTRLKR